MRRNIFDEMCGKGYDVDRDTPISDGARNAGTALALPNPGALRRSDGDRGIRG